jgi:hypothetical protein
VTSTGYVPHLLEAAIDTAEAVLLNTTLAITQAQRQAQDHRHG